MVRFWSWLAALAMLAGPAAARAQAAPAAPDAAAAPPATPPSETAPPAAGDPMAGRALFIGARPFANGASPCGACHAIGGESAPFAASLGPELSQSFAGLDATAVDGMLEDPPFPTMAPLYAGHPITPAERADLTAFLLQASGKPAPGGAQVAAWAALLALVALGALGRVARRRPGSARAELVARARQAPAPHRRRPAVPSPEPARAAPAAAPRAQGGAR